jgi:hypothetical protein
MSGLRPGSAQTHTVAGCQGRFVETDAVGTWVPLSRSAGSHSNSTTNGNFD